MGLSFCDIPADLTSLAAEQRQNKAAETSLLSSPPPPLRGVVSYDVVLLLPDKQLTTETKLQPPSRANKVQLCRKKREIPSSLRARRRQLPLEKNALGSGSRSSLDELSLNFFASHCSLFALLLLLLGGSAENVNAHVATSQLCTRPVIIIFSRDFG